MKPALALLLLFAPSETWWLPSLRAPQIDYYSASSSGPIARLQQRLDRNQTTLSFGRWGYLESVLKELGIPFSSQTLVFSRTSLQASRIGPDHPRALYFNDDLYVGLVHGGLLEIAEADPGKGAVFYTLEQRPTTRPHFVRRNEECLKCHFNANTQNIPGFLTRSMVVNSLGEPIVEAGSFLTDHRSPFIERWGGWYVTGAPTSLRHMGKTSIQNRFNTDAYPFAGSDIVPLMVLNHQVRMHNLFVRLAYEARLDRPELAGTVEATVRYLLFADEWPLRDTTKPVGAFRSEFEHSGPFDRQGRSLRQLDLEQRLFRYPCSFLIYSDSFESLPAKAKDLVYLRLFDVLSGRHQSTAFSNLTPDLRRDILEILIDTKPTLPAYFRSTQ